MGNLTILSGLLNRMYNGTNQTFSLETFDDRLDFEKRVYLLQAFGINLGYDYSWYLRGPYSSTAMDDGYELYRKYTEQGQPLPDDISFAPSSEARFDEFMRFLRETDGNPYYLETLASILFVKTAYGYQDKEEIRRTIQKTKPVDSRLFDDSMMLLKKYAML